MSLEKVQSYFSEFGREEDIIVLNESSATVALAAQALGTKPEQIAKTLSFKRKNQDRVILLVTAGDAKIDNQKFKSIFQEKAFMLKPDEVDTRVGHPVGGVCPFAVNPEVDIYLDESLKRFDYVYPACGSGNSAIKLTVPELEEYTDFQTWIDVCKNW
ncbi:MULTISPECIES: YbaK/EbsC family protein [Enterococcus]|uniref:YbaK/EbsC family protein n=1 Tax=Enterococcus alishanensis TaxID=1303817 RepID=A0ABS6T8L9_9ENTE|nr:YbaK/EbsC family protein [Enterococcus alishanensis]MBV7389246.1 YbaK/EbsC family protein [Enterococcus alishanensis]